MTTTQKIPANVRTPADHATLVASFGEQDEDEITPLGTVDDPRFWRTVGVISEFIGDDATLTLARDWEGCVFGMVEGCPTMDVLAFTHSGHVGYGGVNLPELMSPEAYVRKVRTANENAEWPEVVAAKQSLAAWKQATIDLDYAFTQARVSDIVGYPEYLPSFDEFALNVQGMELP